MTESAYHFIGIGGIGMSGLAKILLECGHAVSGSDLAQTSITESLKKKGATISTRQSGENISPSMTVVYSSDIKKENPEYQAAIASGCRMIHRSEMLSELMQGTHSLAITGTHGKTTTSSLLAWVLASAGADPSFCVGGILPQFRSNARKGEGTYFVAEADESDGSFLRYSPQGAIVTNIGLDHMNYYQTEQKLVQSFRQFMDQVSNPDALFWCGEDSRLVSLNPPGVSYGFTDNCRLQCLNYRQAGWSSFFDITFDNHSYQEIEVRLVGSHNALNTAAVFGTALQLGIAEDKIRTGLKTFGGVARRCEVKGEINSILFLDDYAHHPTEIKTTLQAIRNAEPTRRLIAVFQPHRYTRTRDCLGQYCNIFEKADLLYVTDIHASGETPIPGVDAVQVLNEIQRPSVEKCKYAPREKIVQELAGIASPGDLIVTLGAGNITSVGKETLEMLGGHGFSRA